MVLKDSGPPQRPPCVPLVREEGRSSGGNSSPFYRGKRGSDTNKEASVTIRGETSNSQSGHGFTRHSVVTMRQTWDLCCVSPFGGRLWSYTRSSPSSRIVLQPQDGLRMTPALPSSSFLPFSVTVVGMTLRAGARKASDLGEECGKCLQPGAATPHLGPRNLGSWPRCLGQVRCVHVAEREQG